jgi:multidrug resistance efflux pump
MTYQKAIRDLNSARQKQDIEIARKRDKYQDEEQKLAEMREERKRVVLKSPIDGIFVHGNLTRGKLSDKPSTLKAGAAVTGTQVVGTVVDPGKLQIRLDLQEAQLKTVVPGATCQVTPQAFPDQQLAGVVKSVSMVPYAGSKYDGVVTFRKNKDVAVLPMMVCDVVFELPDGDDQDENKDQKQGEQNDNGKESQ